MQDDQIPQFNMWVERYSWGWTTWRELMQNDKLDKIKRFLGISPKRTGFGLIVPRPEGGATKQEWRFYKAHCRLFHETHWADPREWRD